MTIATEIDNRAKLLLAAARKTVEQTAPGAPPAIIDNSAMARAVLAIMAATDERESEVNSLAGVVMAVIHDQRERGLDYADGKQELNALFTQLWRATLPGAEAQHTEQPV